MQPIVEAADHTVVEHDLRAVWGDQRSSSVSRFAGAGGEAAKKEIVCQNCGGHTTFSGTLTATRCPYCATPIQRDDVHDAPDRLPVDAVLPFHIDEANARAEVDKWINGRWFAPSEFKKYNQTGSFSSIYVAYFTYDATAVTDYTGECGRHYTVTVGSGDDEHTETRTEWRYVSGRVTNAFDDLPVLANTGLDEEKVRELEPWPTQYVRPFSAEYLAGHLSRTYDLTVEQAFGVAKSSMETTIDYTVRQDIGGDEQRVHRDQLVRHDVQARAAADLAAHRHLRRQAISGVHQRVHRRSTGPATLQRDQDRGRRHRCRVDNHRHRGGVLVDEGGLRCSSTDC